MESFFLEEPDTDTLLIIRHALNNLTHFISGFCLHREGLIRAAGQVFIISLTVLSGEERRGGREGAGSEYPVLVRGKV